MDRMKRVLSIQVAFKIIKKKKKKKKIKRLHNSDQSMFCPFKANI
jgi:hypothetical protein